MKILGVLATKGGVGKTTTTSHLGVLAEANGHKVAYLDSNHPQGSLTKLMADRGGNSIFIDPAPHKLLESLSEAHQSGVTFIIIDGTPDTTHNFQHYAPICDLILSPLTTGKPDRDALADLIAVIPEQRLDTLWFFQNKARPKRLGAPNPKNREISELLAEAGLNEVSVMWGARSHFEDSFEEAKTVTEAYPKGEAAKEAQALWCWVQEYLYG